MTLQKTLDAWVKTLSDKSSQKDTPLQESIDAFKAVTAYYAARQKTAKKSGDDEPEEVGGFTFESGTETVNGGSTKVRAGRNS